MGKRIMICVTNDLVTDQRVDRVASTLTSQGYEVRLIGRQLLHSDELKRPYRTHRFRLWFNKGVLFYANYNLQLFFYLLVRRFDAVLCNDLDTLLAGYFASLLKRKTIIYDSHEYFTEVPELVHRKKQQDVWKRLEAFIVPKITYCYTVCDSIAQTYYSLYGNRFEVIRNVPFRIQSSDKVFNPEQNYIIYQGALNLGRGIELMIHCMQHLKDVELYILGAGDVENELKEFAKDLGVLSRVKFLGRKDPKDLKAYTQHAKLGLSFEEDLGMNYRFALPNKLFDYIQANIPVLVSDLPEMKRIVEDYKVGEILQSRKIEKVARQIQGMLDNEVLRNKWIEKTKIAAEELCWGKEEVKLKTIIHKALEA